MKRAVTVVAVALTGLALWWLPEAQSDSEPLQKLWLQAEKETDPARAAALWEALAARMKDSIAPGIEARDAERALFAAYLKMTELEKAESLIAHWPEEEKLQAQLLLARAWQPQDLPSSWKIITQAAAIAKESGALYGVILVALDRKEGALLYPWDGPELAERLLERIDSPRHRAASMHLLALASEEPDAQWPARLHRALLLPLSDAGKRQEALKELHAEAREAGIFTVALDAVSGIENENAQKQLLAPWFKQELKQGEISHARSIAARMPRRAESRGKMLARIEHWRSAHRKRTKTVAEIVGPVADQARAIQKISDAGERRRAFRRLAETTARQNDAYGLLGAPASTPAQKIPTLPDAERLNLTVESLRKKLPLPGPFRLSRIYYRNSYYINTQFLEAIASAEINEREKILAPEVIYLERGIATLPQIHDYLKAEGYGDYLRREGGIYSLRRALLVGREATLIIDGEEVEELRLSRESGAILVNAGEAWVLDSRLVAWDETEQKPALAEYDQREKFRPFFASWSGSRSYLGGNEFVGLGYQNHKSYGITFSSGPKKMQSNTLAEPPRPEGAIVDNSFDNLYYGFYSYEADHVALIGNEYRENIVYGIDPHDRSQALTIAYNTAYGSHKKHGIIISREVNDSSYLGNLSFSNHGSGFMIDRHSHGTYVYANTAFGNGQDGLTLFESGCNLVASNDFSRNKSMGIRLRNSSENAIFVNRLAQNIEGGFYGYASDLRRDAAHESRDFALDPFSQVAAATLVGNRISGNGTGVMEEGMSALSLRSNDFSNQSPRLFHGAWFREHPHLASQPDRVTLRKDCLRDALESYPCRFRDQGLFAGDAQEKLAALPPCGGKT